MSHRQLAGQLASSSRTALPVPAGYTVVRLGFQQHAVYHGSALVAVCSSQRYAVQRAVRASLGLSY